MKRSAITTLLMIGPLFSQPALSGQHPLIDIRQAAKAFAVEAATAEGHESVSASTGQLDRRLRLQSCGSELETFHPPGGRTLGSTTVGVRCTQPHPWTLYVPVQVSVEAEVLVLSHNLPRHHVVQASDFSLRSTDISGLTRGYFQNPEQIIGHRLRRAMQAGTVLTPDALEVPLLVHRGQQVSIEGGNGSIRVRASGEALADGALGDQVRVRNLSSGKVLDARIIGEATVRIR